MAAVAAAPPAGGLNAAPPPWHARLQACLGDAERAVAALLAVCEEPEARAALEVRVHSAGRGSGVRIGSWMLLCKRSACVSVRCRR